MLAIAKLKSRLLQSSGRREFLLLLGVMLLAGTLWLFIEIAAEVGEDDTQDFDRKILLSLRHSADPGDPLGPPWVEEMARDLTALGSIGVLSVMILAVTGFLLLRRRWESALFLFAAVGGGILLSTALKIGFGRSRPDLVYHLSQVYTASFPSGHSMLSAVTYLTLAALLTRTQSGRRIKVYFMSVAILLTIAVGVSRVYMGVHWPTDVLAGWTAGAFWAVLCWLTAHVLQQVRRPAQEDHTGKPGRGILDAE